MKGKRVKLERKGECRKGERKNKNAKVDKQCKTGKKTSTKTKIKLVCLLVIFTLLGNVRRNSRQLSTAVVFIVNIIGGLQQIEHVVANEQISQRLKVAVLKILN